MKDISAWQRVAFCTCSLSLSLSLCDLCVRQEPLDGSSPRAFRWAIRMQAHNNLSDMDDAEDWWRIFLPHIEDADYYLCPIIMILLTNLHDS